MNKCFWFKSAQIDPIVDVLVDQGPNKKPLTKQVHRDVYVVETTESAARIKARRKTDDELGLGQDYQIHKIYNLGPDWNTA